MQLRLLLLYISCTLGLNILLNACIPIPMFDQGFGREKAELRTTRQIQSEHEVAIATNRQPPMSDQVYQKVNPAVVTIYGAKELGSGMIVRAEGLILTNKHVVQNSTQVAIRTITGKVYEGRVVDFDLRHDLALVKLSAQATHLPTVYLATRLDVKAGEKVYAMGSPGGTPGLLTAGTFLRITEYGSLQLSSGLLNPGNSGGPVLNTHGDVIGISKGLLKDNSGLATSVLAARELIGRYQRVNKQGS
ncbi:MAG: trypsin-like peptidase domain-containing protein [Leptolyngbyaceae cyanobacterium RU_5_1]|nr:trypsin-like peptidase domain-containing protein [Leptolyngbyaceae cyanobacterium RU_5_1]